MKVILCTPFIQSDKYVQGGVVVWGANIVNYYKSLKFSDVKLVPVSFDRRTYSENHNSRIGAYVNGFKELLVPVLRAIKLMRKGDVDVIHVSTSLGRSVLKDALLLRVAKHYGVRCFLHFHTGRVPAILNCNGGEHIRLVKNLKLASKGVTMDMRSYKALKKVGINNIVNLPNPLSLSVVNQVAEKRKYIKKVPGRIAFVGHVLRSKGIFELIECCCKIGTPDLHIVGKVLSKDKYEIDALLSKYNTDGGWITWTGEIPHDKVIEELLAAEYFAFPSYTEGFPNVILEAMACSCVIVTTSVGAIPEMLNIGSNACGVCVEPQNADAFYKAFISVYKNELEKAVLSSKAESRVNKLYIVNRVWNQMVEMWKS